MKKYTIAVEETIVGEFDIFAKSEDEALQIARQKYEKAELVLEPGEVQHIQMAVVEHCNDESKWISAL